MHNLLNLPDGRIPRDHSRQVTLKDLVEGLLAGGRRIEQMMDLGCGEGDSLDYFREKIPGVRWVGLDIEKSAEVDLRTRTDGEIQACADEHRPQGRVLPDRIREDTKVDTRRADR